MGNHNVPAINISGPIVMTILVSHNAHDIIIARTITTQSRHMERQTNETDTDNKGISVFMILVRVLPLHAEVPRSDWHMLILRIFM